MNAFENDRLANLDDGWDDVEPAAAIVPPNGRYVARLVSMLPFDRIGEAPKVILVFRLASGRFKGANVRQFLSFAKREVAKSTLALVGLAGVRPSELLAFDEFERLPAVFVTTTRTESRGRIYANAALIEPGPTRIAGGEEPPPAAGEAA